MYKKVISRCYMNEIDYRNDRNVVLWYPRQKIIGAQRWLWPFGIGFKVSCGYAGQLKAMFTIIDNWNINIDDYR